MWQSIETAPKDGVTEFLGWSDRDGVSVFTCSKYSDNPCFRAKNDIESYAYDPTLWMPLPEPPNE